MKRVITSGPPLDQVRQALEVLSSPASSQMKWLLETNLPVDELIQLVFDIVPGWLPLLREAGLSPEAESGLLDLDAYLQALAVPANEALFQDGALNTRDEWRHVRKLATEVLSQLRAG